MDVVTRAFPGEPIRACSVATSPDISYVIGTRKRMVFINPYTGDILGTMSGPDGVSKFLNSVHQLHLRLLIMNRSDPGRWIQSGAGIAILFLSLSGLYLWWPVKRVTIRWSEGGWRRWFDLHNAAGIVSLIFLLILSATGVVIGFESMTTPFFYQITGSAPAPRPRAFSAPHPPDAKPISFERAMDIAREAIPGVAPFAIDVPGPDGVYFIRARYPEDLTPGGRSQIMMDQYTGKVLFVQSSRTAPAGTRLVIWNRAIHTGDVLGIPSKILMSLASLMIVVQLVSGLAMWWKRRK
jgi:uncharacterized iron-regulated membrane protein